MSEEPVLMLVNLDNDASDNVLALSLTESGVRKHGASGYTGVVENTNASNEMDPHNATIQFERGKLNATMEKFEETMIDFDKAQGLKPGHANILGRQGQAKLGLDDFSGDLQDVNTAHELDSDAAWASRVSRMRTKAKYFQDDPEGALHDLNRASMIKPHDADTFRLCGRVKLYQNDHRASLKALDMSNELEPNNIITLWYRALTKYWWGDREGALLDLNQANEIEPNDAVTLGLRAEVKGMLGDYGGALQDANAAYELDPHDVNTLQSRSHVRYVLKDWQGSMRDIERALALDPNNVYSLRYQARLKQAMGDYEGALDVLNKAHRLKPQLLNVLVARATMKHLVNDFQGSLQDLDKAHDVEPNNIVVLKERAALRVVTKDYQGALSDLDKAHQLDPDDFTRGMRKAFRQNSQHYLEAMTNLLPKVLHNVENVFLGSSWRKIVDSYEDLSSQMSFLLEVTNIILQMWTYHAMIVIFAFKYLMGYVERGQWGKYSNGSWEFRAAYVCIELRLGAYPFQKFRDVPPRTLHRRAQIGQPTHHLSIDRSQSFQQQTGGSLAEILPHEERTKYCGVYHRIRKGKQGRPRMTYEPRESSKVDNLKRIYLGEYQSLEEAILTRDVAHFCLGKQGPFNVDPALYKTLAPIPQGQSQRQIRMFVLERAKEVDHLAFKEELETQEMMAELGFKRPTFYFLHPSQQGCEHDNVQSESDDIGGGEFNSSSEPCPVSQADVSSRHETVAVDEVLMSNNLSTNESSQFHARTMPGGDAHPTYTTFEFDDQNHVNAHEATVACNDHPHNEGVVGKMPSDFNFPFFGPTSLSSNELWSRQIIIKAPIGTALLQHNGTQELVYSPTLIRALSLLEIFGLEDWTMVLPIPRSTHSQVAHAWMSNGREGTSESRQYSFRLQKTGTPEELAITDPIRAALDKFRDITGWIPWY